MDGGDHKMKFKWETKKIASMTFHKCFVGKVCVGQVVEAEFNRRNRRGVGWQLHLRTDEYDRTSSGRQLSISSAKLQVEDAAEEWFKLAGVKI